ncbi:hypothetical protein FE257_001007 [Aspergillus nanangensis]|uniref:AMP-dependent synthetase/ligase domain-containing protein n=1 Tax=Aspergillus nanangensis TaxID=2582783 RepID=A0AAD4CTV3_ASPNN|nr:hypothetical protein FE257_001007 [Aspergillus nanangensis]
MNLLQRRSLLNVETLGTHADSTTRLTARRGITSPGSTFEAFMVNGLGVVAASPDDRTFSRLHTMCLTESPRSRKGIRGPLTWILRPFFLGLDKARKFMTGAFRSPASRSGASTPEPSASIAVPLLLHPSLLLSFYHDRDPASAVMLPGQATAQTAILSVLHFAWAITIRSWAGIDTFCAAGDYPGGICYLYDRDVPDTALVELNPEDNLQEAFNLLLHSMASDRPAGSHKASSRSRGDYSAMISFHALQAKKSHKKMPPTSLHVEVVASAGNQWTIHLHWPESCMAPAIAASLLHSFNQALSSITASPGGRIDRVNLCSPHHLAQIGEFTREISPFNNILLHDLCLRHAKTTPDACAIASWDGNLTYAELDDLTARLAHHLVAQGVRPDTFVLSCFPKSTWAIVGRLAILRAGGAYISIDANDPPGYLESIIRRTKTRVMITSPEYVTRFQELVPNVVEVTAATLHSLPVNKTVACPDVRPDSPCLILFTSGSTGAPKGIIQEHRSYATAIADYVDMVGLDATSRVFQFDDYAFDISNNDYLAPLTAGGCCCVPTPEKTITALRENINALKANMTFLTPTVAIQVSPRDMPTLKTVCIGGEPPSRDLLEQWAGHQVRLINQYGMGEAATFCAYNDNLDPARNGIVGRAGSGAIWIANPATPDQLAPVGAVGEILIEGPHLARGYLDQVASTSSSEAGFLSRPPAWMQRIHPTRGPTRVYRSGDLGRYHADGTVEHLGRKDTLLKLNGCRVDSIEVECVLRQCLGSEEEDAVIIDVLGMMGAEEEPVLTAFVHLGRQSTRKDGVEIDIQPVTEGHVAMPLVRRMQAVVAQNLPQHMMPELFLHVDRIPRTKSNKTDRRRLHMYGQDFYMANISPSTRGQY